MKECVALRSKYMYQSLISSYSQPARAAQPVIYVRTVESDPFILAGFPFDEYEVENSPLTQALLTHLTQTKHAAVCWQVLAIGFPFRFSPIGLSSSSSETVGYQKVFMMNSLNGGGPGEPFGFLKASRRKTGHKVVTLVVLPYNYPALWPLLGKIFLLLL